MSMSDLTPVLVATVGATAPLEEALRAMPRAPAFSYYFCSADSQANLPPVALAAAHEIFLVRDPQDFAATVADLRTQLTPALRRWPGHPVIFDFTGGTKCMTAALALVTRRMPGTFQYIGGRRQGTTNIETGTGEALRTANPWDVLGYQAVEEAVTLFDHGSPAAAALLLGRARQGSTGDVRQALEALEFMVRLYAEWDRFEHAEALRLAEEWRPRVGRLAVFFGEAGAKGLEGILALDAEYLTRIVTAGKMSRELVWDLVANAMRRMEEQRYDDAVARLYRATEALGQVELQDGYGLEAGRFPAEKVPEKLRGYLLRGASGRKTLRLGLRDDYSILRELGNPLGARFAVSELGKADEASPLGARNRSILAHGFRPLAAHDAHRLLTGLLALAERKGEDLPLFPKLGRMLL